MALSIATMNAIESAAFVNEVTAVSDRIAGPGPTQQLADEVNAYQHGAALSRRDAHHANINDTLRRSGTGLPTAAEHGADYCPVCRTSGGCL